MLGTMDIKGDEVGYECEIDRMAFAPNNSLLLIGFVADSIKAKSIRAILNTNKKVEIRYSRIHATMPRSKYDYQDPVIKNGWVSRYGETYEFVTHKLRYGMVHVLAWTKSPDFIRAHSPISLWQALKSDTLTTPIVPWWLPWLEKQLIDGRYLTHPWNWRTNCSLLNIDTSSLDEIVTRGLKEGHITIKPPEDYVPSIL